MERIKQMSLKRALFTIVLFHIVAAFLFSLLFFLGCSELSSVIAPQGTRMDLYSNSTTTLPEPPRPMLLLADLLSLLQIALPLLTFTIALISTASMFYRVKLQEPLAVLTEGASRIIGQDLDFTIKAHSPDELGQLCQAFETMRHTLLSNNRELWRQMEERRRLNAAFAHNLRNPVTVLKGSAKIMKKGIASHTMNMDEISQQLSLLENYTDRIERYIETMSSVQRLEEIPLVKELVDWKILVAELGQTISLIGANGKQDTPFAVQFQVDPHPEFVSVDKSILFQVAENLVSNAFRFASQEISVSCSADNGILTFSVADDGSGFPAALLKKGIQPFQKGNEDVQHFGMGLYSSMLLAQKHGGCVEIRNGQTGAIVTATLNIRQDCQHIRRTGSK